MAEFTIHPARREDAGAIRALINTVRINPTGLSWRHFLVARSALGELLGCGQIKTHSDSSRELASIAVEEHARGRGIARAIIESLLQREVQRPLFLMCRARLDGFYRKFGFHRIGLNEMPPYFQRISRVARVFNRGAPPEDHLIVMRLD